MKRVKTVGNSRDVTIADRQSVFTRVNRNKMASDILDVRKDTFGITTRRAALGDIGNRVANRNLSLNATLASKKDADLKKDGELKKKAVDYLASNAVKKAEPHKPLRSNSLLSNQSAKSSATFAAPLFKPPFNPSNPKAVAEPPRCGTRAPKDGAAIAPSVTAVAQVHRAASFRANATYLRNGSVGLPKPNTTSANNHGGNTSKTSVNGAIAKKTVTSSVSACSAVSTATGVSSDAQATSKAASSATNSSCVLSRAMSVPSVVDEVPGESESTLITADKNPLKCPEAYAQVMIPNIDADDVIFPQLVSEFVNDIYDYMRCLERDQAIRPDFLNGQEITGRMRAILIDWLILVHVRFHLLPETIYMTVMLIDRFLQDTKISKDQLQLVGITALFVASKYEEMYAPEIGDFVYIADNTYTKEQVRSMERILLQKLRLNLGRPSAIHFLRRYSKAADANDETHTMAKYFLESTFTDYSLSHCPPSLTAAAALWLSTKLLIERSSWTPTLVHYTTYPEAEVMPVVRKLCKVLVSVYYDTKWKYQAVRNKFKSPKLKAISENEKLYSPLIRQLASVQ